MFIIWLDCGLQIWNHPDVLNRIVQQRKVDDNDLDLEVGPIEGEEKGKKTKGKAAVKSQSPAQSLASSPAPSDTQSSRPPSSLMTDDGPAPFADKKDPVITFEWVSKHKLLLNLGFKQS